MSGPLPTPLRASSGLRLPSRLRTVLFLLLIALVGTGAAWLIAHYGRPEDSLPGPIEPWSMKLHGGAAMVCLFVVGALLYRHILPAWRLGRNRMAGLFTCVSFASLTISGYGLYYFDGDFLHRVTERLHWASGIALPALLVWHIVNGRRARRVRG